MILKIFGIYDSKLKAFMHIFNAPTTGTGIRTFAEASNDPRSQMFKHPDDFSLYEIATWDDESGIFQNLQQHVSHGPASNFKEANNA